MKLNEIHELEMYRLAALRHISDRAGAWAKTAEDALGVDISKVEAIGSVTSKDKFTENSDIDVAFYYSNELDPLGLNEEFSQQLQEIFVRHPEGDLGVINTLVFNEP